MDPGAESHPDTGEQGTATATASFRSHAGEERHIDTGQLRTDKVRIR